MIYLLHGQDTYRSREKLLEIVEEYKKVHKSGLSLKYLFAEEVKEDGFSQLSDLIGQTSLFQEKKLIVLFNFFSNQDFKKKFLKNLKTFSVAEEIILFYENQKILEKDQLLKSLKTKAKIQVFDTLKGRELEKWVEEEFLKYKVKASSEVVQTLITYLANDLWRLSSEIKKLANYKMREGVVLVEDIKLLLVPNIETVIFKTIEAIAQKNKKEALLLLHQHLEKGESPFYLLTMISFQFRNLLIIKDLIEKRKPYYLILKTSGLHPFIVQKNYQQANSFLYSQLKKIYQQLLEIDFKLKTGRINPEIALDLFVAQV